MPGNKKSEYIYGKNSVRELLKTGASGTLYINKSLTPDSVSDIVSLAESLSLPVHFTETDLFNRMFDRKKSQGITLKIENPFPGLVEEKQLLEKIDEVDGTMRLLLLDGITDVGNLGAIIRSALLFDVDAVVMPRNNSAPLNAVVLSRSAGAASQMTISYIANLSAFISRLKKKGFWIYGATMDGAPLGDVEFDKRTAIVMGSEHSGIRNLVAKSCDLLVSIPTNQRLDSLNVSVSTGILLYECARQQVK
jgi:23S rRNA (guanosine2251-2'-O)-methyltransferase